MENEIVRVFVWVMFGLYVFGILVRIAWLASRSHPREVKAWEDAGDLVVGIGMAGWALYLLN